MHEVCITPDVYKLTCIAGEDKEKQDEYSKGFAKEMFLNSRQKKFLASSEMQNQFWACANLFPNQSLRYLLDFFCWQKNLALRMVKEINGDLAGKPSPKLSNAIEFRITGLFADMHKEKKLFILLHIFFKEHLYNKDNCLLFHVIELLYLSILPRGAAPPSQPTSKSVLPSQTDGT